MTTIMIIVAIVVFLAWINSASSNEGSNSSSSMFDSDTDTGTSLFSDKDTSFHHSCSWCGSSTCSGGIDCMNSSNPLSGFHEDHMHDTSTTLFSDTDMFHHDTSSMFDSTDSFSSISSHSSFDD